MEKSISQEKLREVLKNIHQIWDAMCYVEQCRFLQNTIKRISLFEDHLKVEPNIEGLGELLKEAGKGV